MTGSSRLKIQLMLQVPLVSGPLPAWLPAIYLLSHSHLLLTVFFFPLSFLRHLDFFEMLRNEDELEFAKRFELVSMNIADADSSIRCHGSF